MKEYKRVSALAVFAALAIGCGGGGSGGGAFGGSLFENYLAIADDGTGYLIEYEVSQGFLSSGPFTDLPPINDAAVYDGTLDFVASMKNEPTLLTAQYDGTSLVGPIQEFPIAGATTLGVVAFDGFHRDVYVIADSTTVVRFHVGTTGDLTGGTTVLSDLPLIRDLIVGVSGMYVVTDQRVFVYTLTGTGNPQLINILFAFDGVQSFKLSRGGFDEAAFLLTRRNRLRAFDVDFAGDLIPVNEVNLDWDLVERAKDIAPFSIDACLVATVDGEAILVHRDGTGLFHATLSAFLDEAGDMRSIEVDYLQERLLVTDGTGTVRGFLLQSDGEIGAVTADATVAIGVAVQTKLLSIEFVP
ncbi:MAG: hypothetical protein IH944_14510 [Armatimonadetes bacterium]|nr:hypothetical protein [Armatimonadota bacterium]